jgi:hypothetical protein
MEVETARATWDEPAAAAAAAAPFVLDAAVAVAVEAAKEAVEKAAVVSI